MSTRSAAWPAGVPCWVDLASTATVGDPGAARAFYSAVFGRIAVLADASSAVFGVIQNTGEDLPDRSS